MVPANGLADEHGGGDEPDHRECQIHPQGWLELEIGLRHLGPADPQQRRDHEGPRQSAEVGDQDDQSYRVWHADDLSEEIRHGFAFFCRGTRTVAILTHYYVFVNIVVYETYHKYYI